MIRLDDLELAYVPVPKAACSTVKAMLAAIDPTLDDDGIALRGEGRFHTLYRTMRFDPRRLQRALGLFRFTVIREPAKRLISAYLNRVVERGELIHSPRVRRSAQLPVNPDPDFFFQNLYAYQCSSSLVKHHTLPMWMFAGKEPEAFDAVYTTSQLRHLQADLSHLVAWPLDLPRVNPTQTEIGLDDLKPETLGCLRDYLAEDYRVYRAYFPNPF